MIDFVIRAPIPTDRGFIIQSCVHVCRMASTEHKHIPREVFYPRTIANVLRVYETSEVRVAGLPDDKLTILGFALVAPKSRHVHMVFVKKPWRQSGIGKSLVSDMLHGCTFTCWTRECYDWICKKYPQFVYNPFSDEYQPTAEVRQWQQTLEQNSPAGLR